MANLIQGNLGSGREFMANLHIDTETMDLHGAHPRPWHSVAFRQFSGSWRRLVIAGS